MRITKWRITKAGKTINLTRIGRKAARASKDKVIRDEKGRFKSKEFVTHDPPLIDRVHRLEQQVLGDVGRSLKERIEALEQQSKKERRLIEIIENVNCGGGGGCNGTC